MSSREMTADSFELSIARPCCESWETMSVHGGVRFCETCRKNVIDVSSLTQDQAKLMALRMASGEKLCGRIIQREDGTLLHRPTPTLTTSTRFGGMLLSAALTVSLPAIAEKGASQPLSAFTEVPGIVSGRVLKPDGTPVSGGLVFLYGLHSSAPVYVLDEIGRFEISAPPGEYTFILQTGPEEAEKIADVVIHAGPQVFGDVRTQQGRADLTRDTSYTTLGEIVAVTRWSWKSKLRHPVLYARYLGRRIR